MSITDKLPEPPKGYRWKTSLFSNESIRVRLEHDPRQGFPYYGIRAEGYADRTDESIIEIAYLILPAALVELAEYLADRAERDALNRQYAHLLTN